MSCSGQASRPPSDACQWAALPPLFQLACLSACRIQTVDWMAAATRLPNKRRTTFRSAYPITDRWHPITSRGPRTTQSLVILFEAGPYHADWISKRNVLLHCGSLQLGRSDRLARPKVSRMRSCREINKKRSA